MRRLTTPEQVPSQIEMWQVEFDFTRPVAVRGRDCLSQDEQAHAAGFRQVQDRVRYSTMRAALRHLLASRLACRPEALQFASNAFGKPRLASSCGLAFNQSHSARAGLLVLADGLEVGVDIESRDMMMTPEDIEGMSVQMLTARERQLAGRLDTDAFLQRWVGKEAALKALGVGISQHLHTLEVGPQDDGSYKVWHGQPGWPQVHARRLETVPGYAAALAWIEP